MQNIFSIVLSFFKFITTIPEQLIEPIGFLPEFAKEALIDSLNLIPFLFVVFLFIEIFEHYFTKKKHLFVFWMKKIGPFFGSLLASIPQCGFSVIATTLYTKRILSRGTLLAVYLATSDEAIPVIIAEPSKIYLVLPIILVKVILAIIVGYVIDLIVPQVKEVQVETKNCECSHCHHQHNRFAEDVKTKAFWLNPLKHTLNIFVFILIVSLILGFILTAEGTEENLAKHCLMNSPLQPVLASIIGLIPNCAVSVMLTLLFIKHTISFGSLIAGLSSAGGLGLLVLFKQNCNKKDTALIIGILIVVSSIIGLVLQYNFLGINNLFNILGLSIN